ncbi:hypothetical protein [Exiguobacterium sp. s166]|uniref:hypothetical protein n=1 Tax=Exiguobacterium sp. s166 TaxID=2751204 RepID=UPI001BE9B94E|nr:hypothetical protein [Exiguobacterium sp. s166]
MRQADRLLKAIYREPFMRVTNDQFERVDLFNFSDENFRMKCKTNYLKLYPQNYTGDELDEILNYQNGRLKNSYKKTNTAYMFLYYAQKMFKIKNKQIIVSYEHLLEWDGFQNKVDANVFIGAYAAAKLDKNLVCQSNIVINHDNDRVYQILRKGVCEGHMHLKGSGLTTELSWISFLGSSFISTDGIYSFVQNNNNFREYKSYGYTENEIVLSLQKVKLARIILDQAEELDSEILKKFKKMIYINDLEIFKVEALLNKEDLEKSINSFNKKLQKEERYSIVSERLFYEKMFLNLTNKTMSTFYLNLFNFYIWGASVFKFELNQDNVGMGFQKFKYQENVKDQLIKDNTLIYKSVFEKYYEEGVIRKIEFRIAPKNINEIKKLIKKLDEINNEVHCIYSKKKNTRNYNLPLIEYGLIIHYIKRDDLAQNPNSDRAGRYKNYIEIVREDARKVEKVLEWETELASNPLLAETFKRKIVAIDAANTEIGCPPEIFGVSFRKHRYTCDPFGGINFTFHVGEEFKTLESGIRNVDEAIDYLEYRRGDRLGHALALGIDASAYFKRKRYKVVTSLQDYIDNIAWLYGIYSQPCHFNEKYIALLTAMYDKHKHHLFKDFFDFSFTISDYIQSMRLRSDDSVQYTNREIVNSTSKMLYSKQMSRETFQFNDGNPDHSSAFMNTKARLLNYHYIYDSNFISNSRTTIEYKIEDEWINLVSHVQLILRDKLVERGIVVEANPSSNRKISSVQNFSELPFLVMNSYHLEDSDKKHVSITINTDDSAIFQTNLSNEYSLIARSLELEGYQPERIYSYLEYLREASCIHNFVN